MGTTFRGAGSHDLKHWALSFAQFQLGEVFMDRWNSHAVSAANHPGAAGQSLQEVRSP